MAIELKTVGSRGQISLGKQHAGRNVAVEEVESGVWLVKAVQVIPENELWLHTPQLKTRLDRALDWAAKNPAKASNLEELSAKLKKRC